MNKDEIINYVADKLEAQGQRSAHGMLCVYNHMNGAHCAVGWVLKLLDLNEEQEKKVREADLENHDVKRLYTNLDMAGYLPYWFSDNIRFFKEMQIYHDDVHNWPFDKLGFIKHMNADEYTYFESEKH